MWTNGRVERNRKENRDCAFVKNVWMRYTREEGLSQSGAGNHPEQSKDLQ